MGDQGFVSVIVPVYNGGWCLEQCLAGIRKSSYPDYEIIVVDNGSTDNSVAIASDYGAAVGHCPGPSGPGAARNVGAQQARGEILMFVDADVVIHQDTMARITARFRDDPGLAVVFGSYDDSPAAKNFLSQYKNLLHHFVHQQGNSQASTFWAGCGAIRKVVFQTVGGFDLEKYPTPSIEDIELGDRLHRLGYRILLDKEVQAQHLKEWRLLSLLRAEIFYRAIPWSRLILEQKGLLDDLNLKTSQRVSAGFACLAGVLVPLCFVRPSFVAGVLLALAFVLVLNQQLFLFFLRHRGIGFTIRAFFMHIFYFIYSSAAFALCWAQQVARPRPDARHTG